MFIKFQEKYCALTFDMLFDVQQFSLLVFSTPFLDN